MSVQELKEILIEQIKHEEDEHVLLEAIRILNHEMILKEPDVIYLSEKQKEGLDEALEDVKAGRTFSHDEIEREFDDFFDKKEWENEKG